MSEQNQNENQYVIIPSVQYREESDKKKSPSRMKFAVILTAVCMIGSGIFGFAGTYAANMLNGSLNDTVSAAPISTVITTAALSGTTKKLSVEEVAAIAKNSVVEITTEMVSSGGRMRQYVSTGAGSGVVISADGYIVTNNHVVSGAQTITVRLSNKSEYKAKLVGTDSKSDLAVVKINATGLTPAVFGNSDKLTVGETTVAIGNPLGELGGTVTAGIVSALDREITIDGEAMSLLQTDASINPGNSGGGLFNLYGELIGIVNAKSSGSDIEGLGFAIPINTAKTVTEELITYGYVTGRIDTGFVLVDIQDAQTALYYRVNKLGLYISKSANSADFKSGDIITSVDGKSVSDLAGFNQIMNKHSVGDTVKITVSRNGRSETYSLTLKELKT